MSVFIYAGNPGQSHISLYLRSDLNYMAISVVINAAEFSQPLCSVALSRMKSTIFNFTLRNNSQIGVHTQSLTEL